jgi:heterotetrameric sarcosine oxidase gamma subunit
MPERASSLAQSRAVRGLSHRSCGTLVQYHAWPERYAEMAGMLARQCGIPDAPAPGKALSGAEGSLLRIHPQRFWLVSEQPRDYPALDSQIGATLDLSHARTIIHVAEEIAVPLLSRFIAIDLRPHRFAVDDVAITPLHRVSVVLWRRRDGIDILAPRSFARSIWDVLAEAAEQLG